LRVLRVARFAARFHRMGFRVADDTLNLMRALAERGELQTLSPERIWQETVKALVTDHPEIYFETLKQTAALAIVFPEIHRLYGVPQPAKWHPEIDTGIHTMMALVQSARITSDPVVRFAVLVHDLGKGTTPKELLPRHVGHEHRSVDLIVAMTERLRVPKRYLRLAVAVARYHGMAHRAHELRPGTLLELLESIGALRDPATLDDFIAACQADARGRTGLEKTPYPQGDRLRLALSAATAVTGAALTDTALEGEAFGARLKSLRIDAIRAALES
jgi:tRNA nucleotidyltransferase (CCA-adding enzyme)